MTADEIAGLFWGKAGPKAKGTSLLHPALFHMIDVGMVARVMVERSCGAAVRGLGLVLGRTTEEAARIIGFLVALHDLGKICPGFQAKRRDLIMAQENLGYRFPTNAEEDHGHVTLQYLRWRVGGASPATTVARAIAAHHGGFHPKAPARERAKDGIGLWGTAREAAVAALGEIFVVDAETVLRPEEFSPADTMILAGLTSVADWIGSDKRFFPPEGEQPRPVCKYAEYAYGQAHDALTVLDWDPWQPDRNVWEFERLFPDYSPNTLQQLVARIAVEAAGPCMVIIEAPMGIGKTEAGLHLADVLMNRFGHAGLYDALPTQATSNRIFRRVQRDYLSNRLHGHPANLHLLHSLAAFDDAYAELLEGPRPEMPHPSDISDRDGRPDSLEASVTAASWFRGRKLGLLSPFAVGTLDQSLLGILQSRHMFVRLYGLANKVVLIDEAHAYDTYTSTLLDCLVEWLAALGCSIIILSATLPEQRRQDLARAYCGKDTDLPSQPYPRVTVVAPKGPVAAYPVPDTPRKEVIFECLPIPPGASAEAAVAERLEHELREGGCAAWICNTVDAAQLAYLHLRRLREHNHSLFRDTELILYHARFPVDERLEIETQVDRKFGKEGIKTGNRPYRAVLIGTQVLEQSLDYTVDVMITELAPGDLILQRAGRLHRHAHPRPGPLEQARLLWLPPQLDAAGEPHFGVSGKIYEEAVLLRSWWALRHYSLVELPRDIEALVEEIYGARKRPMPEGLQALADRLQTKADIRQARHETQALVNALNPPDDEDPFWMDMRLPDEEGPTDVRGIPGTRLAEPSIMLVCAHQHGAEIVLSLGDPRPLNLRATPDREEEARLLHRSVRVQNAYWVRHFHGQPVPEGWAKSSVLQRYRLAVFTDGELAAGGRVLRLDGELGVVTSDNVIQALYAG